MELFRIIRMIRAINLFIPEHGGLEIIYVSCWITEYTPRVSKFLVCSSGRERISKRREFNTTLRQSPKPIGR